VRDQVRDRDYDHWFDNNFWQDHPYLTWRYATGFNPWLWGTWAGVTGWMGGTWSEPAYYSYGEDVYYDDGTVYYDDQPYATAEEYATEAQEIATSAPEVDQAAVEWLPLGVFAITQDGRANGPEPTMFVQLAVSKEGVISGTFQNTATDKVQSVEGMVDKKSQRVAWGIVDKKWPIMETGLQNLTQDTAPALVHFENGETQQWLLVRLDQPQAESTQEK
jgi:hypothetical protein